LSLQESYPQLRSIDAFMTVQTELAGTENRIKVARDDYSKAVTDYNTTRNQFPTVLPRAFSVLRKSRSLRLMKELKAPD
jgi:LemA protein